MEEYVLTPSHVWGAMYKARGSGIMRAMKKRNLTQRFAYPILDNSSVFAWRPRGRRGPASESQTLIVAYPYKGSVDHCDTYDAFISATQELGLRVVKEDAIYRGHAAYRIIVADHDVDMEAATVQLPVEESNDDETQAEEANESAQEESNDDLAANTRKVQLNEKNLKRAHPDAPEERIAKKKR